MPASAAPANSTKKIVLSIVDALNRDDLPAARAYFADDFSFSGVLGSRHGADAYFTDMERMRLKYEVKKALADGEDVCLLYDLAISGMTIFGCAWYRVERGKVKSLRVVFDPRPLLESKK